MRHSKRVMEPDPVVVLPQVQHQLDLVEYVNRVSRVVYNAS